MLRPTFIIIVLSLLTVLLYSPRNSGEFFSELSQSRILFLTAHPDDECLFFGPTILGLAQQNSQIYALSLSTGNADGRGAIRSQEFHKSYDLLGIPGERRWVLDQPDLQDNLTATWNPRIISREIMSYVTSNDIDVILTFDYGGISSHPNHISLPYGVAHLIQSLYALDQPIPRLYTLTTVPLFAKYSSLLAPLIAKLDILRTHVFAHMNVFMRKEDSSSIARVVTSEPIFVAGIPEYLRALQAMRMHKSQLVWFRWLYVTFSRYMWVNEWLEVQLQL